MTKRSLSVGAAPALAGSVMAMNKCRQSQRTTTPPLATLESTSLLLSESNRHLWCRRDQMLHGPRLFSRSGDLLFLLSFLPKKTFTASTSSVRGPLPISQPILIAQYGELSSLEHVFSIRPSYRRLQLWVRPIVDSSWEYPSKPSNSALFLPGNTVRL